MTGGRHRLLLVEDDDQVRRLLHTALGEEYEPVDAPDGRTALRRAAERPPPDLVLLDLGLPDIDGLDLLERLRQLTDAPIVVLTAREAEDQKVAALDGGADDYVVKPFLIGELRARLRTALRHRLQSLGARPVIRAGEVEIDLVNRTVTLAQSPVRLTAKEYELLSLLASHAGRVLTHRMLLEKVWGPAHVNDTQYLRVYVGQLRQKLHDDPLTPRLIKTELGVGYRLEAD